MEAKKHFHAQGEEVQSLQCGSNQCWWVIEFAPNFQSNCQLGYYTCTLDSSTLVQKSFFPNHKILWRNIPFVEMEISKLTKCLMNMCWIGHARYYDNNQLVGFGLFW
jgi:hypothetical protein